MMPCDLQHESDGASFKVYLPNRGEYIVPCPNCRPRDFEQRRADIIAGKSIQQPLAYVAEMAKETENERTANT